MNDKGLDQLFGNAERGGDFLMEEAHLQAALGMIKEERRRKLFFWWWMVGAVALAVALWLWSPWTDSTTTPLSPLVAEQSSPHQMKAETEDTQVVKEEVESIEQVINLEPAPLDHTPALTSYEDSRTTQAGETPVYNTNDNAPVIAEMEMASEEATYPDRTFNDIRRIDQLASDPIHRDMPPLSSGSLKEIRTPLPLKWNALIEINNHSLNNASTGLLGGRIGITLVKPLSPRTYLALEPMLSWSTDFAEDHLLIETLDYGLEVSSRAYRVQPDLVISGQVNLHLGWVSGRWKLQTGPSLFALPWAQGEIHELDVDQGQWSDLAKVGSGRLDSDLSESWAWGWSGTALYHLTPRWHLGFSVNYQDRSFFQKRHYEGREDALLNIGLRTQYQFGL